MALSREALEYAVKLSDRLDNLELCIEEARLVRMKINFALEGVMGLSDEIGSIERRLEQVEEKLGVERPDEDEKVDIREA